MGQRYMGPEQDILEPARASRLPATKPRCSNLKRSIYLLFATKILLDVSRAVIVSVLKSLPASLDEPEQKCADRRHKKHGRGMARKCPDESDEAKCDTPCLDRKGTRVKVLDDFWRCRYSACNAARSCSSFMMATLLLFDPANRIDRMGTRVVHGDWAEGLSHPVGFPVWRQTHDARPVLLRGGPSWRTASSQRIERSLLEVIY